MMLERLKKHDAIKAIFSPTIDHLFYMYLMLHVALYLKL